MRPANIFWRIAQGVIDDLIITAAALCLAWSVGVIPGPKSFINMPPDLSSFIDNLTDYLAVAAQIGGTFAIYVTLKLVYYVTFVAWKGQTLACYCLRLRIVLLNGDSVTLAGSVKRAVAGGVLSHTPMIGHFLRVADYAAALLNRRKQAVRDIVAGTMLVHDEQPPPRFEAEVRR